MVHAKFSTSRIMILCDPASRFFCNIVHGYNGAYMTKWDGEDFCIWKIVVIQI